MYNLMFTGGGSRGFSYIGVLEAIEELKPEINIYAGSSIGAIMLTMYALGYSQKEIKTEFEKINMLKLFCDFNFGILFDCSISKGEIYLKKLREFIERKYYGERYKKGKMPPVCFKDVDKKIYVIATDLEEGEAKVFSKKTTPETEIAKALRASSSMPFLMQPFKIDGKTYIDGDILRATPIYLNIPEILNEKLIEIRITGIKKTKPTKNPVKFVNNVVSIFADATDNNAVRENSNLYPIIKIETENVGYTDFFMSKEMRKSLYETGYNITMTQMKERIKIEKYLV